jgi:hypothetical protein
VADGSTFTLLGGDAMQGSNLSAGDTLEIDIVDDTIEAFLNGSSQGTRTDTTYSSGEPGVQAYRTTTSGADIAQVVMTGESSGASLVVLRRRREWN